jgi:hypothetical protein
VTPDTVAFAVRSLVRLGSAAREAYEQSVRDAAIQIQDLPVPVITDDEALFGFFDVGERRKRIEDGGDLQALWVENSNHDMVPRDAAARDILIAEQLKILEQLPPDYRQSWIVQRFSQQGSSGTLVQQWKKGTGPPTPAARLVLAFADVALDYVGSNPGILGIGGNGEKLISALSANFRKMLPDVDKKDGWKGREATHFFVERALAISLHAGLKTVSENAGLLVEEAHYRDLLQNIVQPFVTSFDKNPNERPQWIDVRDNLLGPMVESGLRTLQKNQEAFFGKKFAPSSAVGAVTSALLGASADGSIADVFTPEGTVRLYRTVLDLAVQNPRLFVGAAGPKSDVARDLLQRVAKAVKDAPPGLDKSLATNVALAAIDVLRGNVPGLLRIKDDAWRNVAGDLANRVLTGLEKGLATGDAKAAFETVFSPEEAAQLLAIFMKQFAQTPGMILGGKVDDEIEALIATVAALVASRGAELLTTSDWFTIAEALAKEVARNPLRLIAIGLEPKQQLAARILEVVLSAAAQSFPGGKRTQASLLFGDTLRDVMIVAIAAAAGNAGKAAAHLDDLRQYVELLNALAAENPLQMGAREWIRLFEANIVRILDVGLPPGLTKDILLEELKRK